MKRLIVLMQVILLIILTVSMAGAAILPGTHQVDGTPQPDDRLPSNSIIDLIPVPGSLWLGTGRGVSQYYLDGRGWFVARSGDDIGPGGVSAITVTDSVIWAATAYSENTDAGVLPAGGGVGYSRDGGETWSWQSQPVDLPQVEDYHPTTTNIQNVTYDIALSDSAVWITSWGGGLRKKMYDRDYWEVITPDGQPFWPVNDQYINHRAFSVTFANEILWVGTAAGVWVSRDEGQHFVAHAFKQDEPSVSGNFITALGVQESPTVPNHNNIWAASWKANGLYEYYGVSVTEDNGASWRVALSDSTVLPSGRFLIDEYGPLHVHNFGFAGQTVYAPADGALWVSIDNGREWAAIEEIFDTKTGERLSNINFFSALPVGDSLWVGTDAGLAVGWFDSTSAFTWSIIRAHQRAGVGETPSTYAYPSPFSPRRGQVTRFQVPANGVTEARVTIFNFAMEPLYDSGLTVLPGLGTGDMAGYGAVIWNGLDSDGQEIANGVYYYQLKSGGNTWWGKVMVLD